MVEKTQIGKKQNKTTKQQLKTNMQNRTTRSQAQSALSESSASYEAFSRTCTYVCKDPTVGNERIVREIKWPWAVRKARTVRDMILH